MIELKGVSKSYGGSVVLHEIDLTIAAGRTTVLIGPSGCGKSTLLRLMIGLVQPDSGSVAIAGTELTPATVLEVRHGLGYVIQDGGLFPHLNARDNVILMARYLGWESVRIERPAWPARRADAGFRKTASTASPPSSRAVSASA